MSVFDWALTLEQEREEPVVAGRRVDGRSRRPAFPGNKKNPHTWTGGRT